MYKNTSAQQILSAKNNPLKNISLLNPFECIEYLVALENSNCASKETGWQPMHFYKSKRNKSAFINLYKKNNSHGEFVFDYSWANAFIRNGLSYYPKLVSAIPFTPCKSKKVFGDDEISNELIDEIKKMMHDESINSWHILFPVNEERKVFLKHDFIERFGYRFVWQNKNFVDFEDYLSIFKSRQRKNIIKERNSVRSIGIEFDIFEADDISLETWRIFFNFYQITYHERGQAPYLNLAFFEQIEAFKTKLKPVLFFARQNGEYIGASLCFKDKKTLYGRHWGATKNIRNLHFEACYYQGIKYCIKHGISSFDPGVQGEHKIRRGFEPIKTSSLHFFTRKDFSNAIKNFCVDEEKQIDSYLVACKNFTPFNNQNKMSS